MARTRMTYGIAMAAASDAGNRSMRTAGRSKWAVEDWNAMVAEFDRLNRAFPCAFDDVFPVAENEKRTLASDLQEDR
jgi:hypothetical protein